MEGERVPTGHTSDESERKLWLDYIGKLNDRHRRSIGSSGATSWVLFGVIAAVLFKIIPQLPSFLANRANLQSSLVSLLFEFDATFMFVAAYVYLLYFHLGGMAARAVPERNRRVHAIIHIGIMIAQICLVLSHFLVALSPKVGPNSLRRLLAGIALFWANNFYMLVKGDIHRFRQARQHGIPIPWFEGTSIDARLGAPIGFGITALLGIFFLSGLVWYVSLQWRALIG